MVQVQVLRTVKSLNGTVEVELDTGGWSVDIAFPEYNIALEVCPCFQFGKKGLSFDALFASVIAGTGPRTGL